MSLPQTRCASLPGLGVLPPPLWGRGGEGVMRLRAGGATRANSFGPPPPAPPHKGEGSTPNLRRGLKPRHPWPKAAFIGQTAHRFAAGNLLRQRRASALDCVFVRRINRLSQNRAAPGPEKATPAWT